MLHDAREQPRPRMISPVGVCHAQARFKGYLRVAAVKVKGEGQPFCTDLTKTRTGPDPRTGLNSRKTPGPPTRMPGLRVVRCSAI